MYKYGKSIIGKMFSGASYGHMKDGKIVKESFWGVDHEIVIMPVGEKDNHKREKTPDSLGVTPDIFAFLPIASISYFGPPSFTPFLSPLFLDLREHDVPTDLNGRYFYYVEAEAFFSVLKGDAKSYRCCRLHVVLPVIKHYSISCFADAPLICPALDSLYS